MNKIDKIEIRKVNKTPDMIWIVTYKSNKAVLAIINHVKDLKTIYVQVFSTHITLRSTREEVGNLRIQVSTQSYTYYPDRSCAEVSISMQPALWTNHFTFNALLVLSSSQDLD